MSLLLLLSAWAAEPVTPTFGWAEGDAWAVRFSQRNHREDASGLRMDTEVDAAWTMRVEAGRKKSLVARVEGYALEGPRGMPDNDLSAAFTLAVLAAAPSFQVARDGSLAGLVDVAAARAPMDAVLDANPRLTAETREAVRALAPDAQLLTMARSHWAGLVGVWAGQPWTEGEAVPGRSLTVVPALGGALVELAESRTYGGAVPCAEGEAEARCARFVHRSTLEPGSVEEAVSARANAIAAGQGAAPALVVEGLSMETVTTLTTEPDGLRPRLLEVRRVIEMRARVSGVEQVTRQEERRSWTFTPL